MSLLILSERFPGQCRNLVSQLFGLQHPGLRAEPQHPELHFFKATHSGPENQAAIILPEELLGLMPVHLRNQWSGLGIEMNLDRPIPFTAIGHPRVSKE